MQLVLLGHNNCVKTLFLTSKELAVLTRWKTKKVHFKFSTLNVLFNGCKRMAFAGHMQGCQQI